MGIVLTRRLIPFAMEDESTTQWFSLHTAGEYYDTFESLVIIDCYRGGGFNFRGWPHPAYRDVSTKQLVAYYLIGPHL